MAVLLDVIDTLVRYFLIGIGVLGVYGAFRLWWVRRSK